ncbi:MAG: AMP-binding protein, partial [Mycobacterium sp.]|nr:AMP-binding protein [Mycobacterium sp.]
VPPHVQGNIVLGLPLPPGCTTGLWRDQGRYKRGDLAVFPSHYHTGDSGYFDEDGYLYVLGRSDDVINVGGERLSTGTIEAAITGCPGVAESAVVGVPDRTAGQRPLAYVVLENDNQTDPALLREHIALEVRQKVGPIAELDDVVLVSALPKTSSGKVLRKTIREISTGRPVHLPATLEDPAAVHELAQQAEQRSGEGDYPTHRTTRW